uniref:Protein FAM33A n=1 Tax=Poecilia latipinna TaxID=48699 RepID=A0A3B3VRS8_9TELE
YKTLVDRHGFLKSEADLEYIERRLKLDFINGASARGSFAKENVTGILENLKSIKAKHSLLRCQVSQITDAQKGSMELIRNRLSTAMELIKHCQQASHLEVTTLFTQVRHKFVDKPGINKLQTAEILLS